MSTMICDTLTWYQYRITRDDDGNIFEELF